MQRGYTTLPPELKLSFNRSSATSLYATSPELTTSFPRTLFQSLKRDIPLCNFAPDGELWHWQDGFNRSSATSLYATAMMKFRQAIPMMFQSLKRDIPLCNPSSMRTQAQRVISGTLARGL